MQVPGLGLGVGVGVALGVGVGGWVVGGTVVGGTVGLTVGVAVAEGVTVGDPDGVGVAVKSANCRVHMAHRSARSVRWRLFVASSTRPVQ